MHFIYINSISFVRYFKEKYFSVNETKEHEDEDVILFSAVIEFILFIKNNKVNYIFITFTKDSPNYYTSTSLSTVLVRKLTSCSRWSGMHTIFCTSESRYFFEIHFRWTLPSERRGNSCAVSTDFPQWKATDFVLLCRCKAHTIHLLILSPGRQNLMSISYYSEILSA